MRSNLQPPNGENYRGKHFDKRSCYNLECNYLELEIGVPLFRLRGRWSLSC